MLPEWAMAFATAVTVQMRTSIKQPPGAATPAKKKAIWRSHLVMACDPKIKGERSRAEREAKLKDLRQDLKKGSSLP